MITSEDARVHLAVADIHDEQVQELLAERPDFKHMHSGCYSVGDVVIHVVAEGTEWAYARCPVYHGDPPCLLAGAIVRDPQEDSSDYEIGGALEEGSPFVVIVHEPEWRQYEATRRAVLKLCAPI